jgi:hypothetical protein
MCAMKLYDIPEGKVTYRHDLIEQNTVVAGTEKFVFTNEAQAKLLYEAATFFGPGRYRLPDNEQDARLALEDWQVHKRELEEYFWKRARRRSDRREFQEGMVEEFWNLYRRYRRGHYHPIADANAPLHKIPVEQVSDGDDAVIEFSRIPRQVRVPRPVARVQP